MGNSEMLSSSTSSRGVILELEGEHAEDSESNDLGMLRDSYSNYFLSLSLSVFIVQTKIEVTT